MGRIPPIFGETAWWSELCEVVFHGKEAQDGASTGGDRRQEICCVWGGG